jgi:glucan biosynthesis protein C
MVAQHRIHALDAVRAFALLAGIVLHASMSFFNGSFPVKDSSPITYLAFTFYVIHIFRMSLFFLLAGFFAHMMLHRRGTRAFVKDRSKRILVPMVAGWFIFVTPTIVILHGDFVTPWGLRLLHLWFLYYLAIFYFLALTLREAFDSFIDRDGRIRGTIDALVRRMTSTYMAPLVLAAPLFVVLYLNEGWSLWGGIPGHIEGFTPAGPMMVAYGTAFGFGWFLHRQVKLLGRWQATWQVHLGIGMALTAVCLSIVGIEPGSAVASTVQAWDRIAYIGCYTAAIWFWTFGIIGAGLRFCSQESPVRRYLSDSSYYLYLAHMPVVVFLQVLFATAPLYWAIKFSLILAIALIVLLMSYHYWVRPTFIGALLNGGKYPRHVVGAWPEVAAALGRGSAPSQLFEGRGNQSHWQ